MSFLKRRSLYVAVGLVVLLCVSLGAFLAWRANQPVEPKTVYVMPEPNPERAEVLKRMTQPPRQVYAPKASVNEATDAPTDNTDDESSSQEIDLEDEHLESMLLAIDEETAARKSDFPPIPDGFLENNPEPVWLSVPGYQKGDMPEHEKLYKVLIKLWNQGERGFHGGTYDPKFAKVYPLYPDVFYVTWHEATAYDVDGNPLRQYKSIGTGFGMQHYEFTPVDFMKGTWKTKYPNLKILDKNDYGYDPNVFLTTND